MADLDAEAALRAQERELLHGVGGFSLPPMLMRVWSHRPQFSHWALFTAAFVLGCGFAKALAIVPGSSVSFWPPGGLLMAALMLTPTPSWPWWILGGALAESFGQLVWFSSGLPIGFLIIAGNALEAMVGAWLVNRVCGRPVRLETLPEVLTFVVLGAGLAPAISATVGSATLAWFGIRSQTFWASWPLWWIGDATGILIVAPLALIVIQNWRGVVQLSAVRWLEVSVVGLFFLGVAGLSLGGYLPFAYIVMPPLLWAAVRFDFKGAAVTLILLALITAVFTLSGASQFAGDPESQRHKQVMLHLFLAVSALSALIVAAISHQHQQALATLRESERQLRELVDVVPVAIARLAPDGDPTFFNKRMIDFLGLDVTDIEKPGLSRQAVAIATSLHPDDAAGFAEALEHSLVTGKPFSRKYRLRRASGVYRWVEGRIEPLRDQRGKIVQWYGVSIDIDDQVRLYSELEEREAKIRRLFDSDIIGIVTWDLDGRLIDANDEFLRMVRYERVDLQAGLRWFDMTPPEWQEVHAREEAEELARTGKMVAREKEFFRKDGSRVPVLIGAVCFEGQSRQGVAFILELTERKRAETALRDRERELVQLVDMLPVYIRRLTAEGEPVFFNKRLTDFIGVDLADIGTPGMTRLGPAIENFVHPDEAPKVGAALRRAVDTGEGYTMRYRMRGAEGVYRWIETRAEPLRNRDGTIAQWYSVSIDIDDQMRAEEALRRSQDKLARAAQAASLSELSASIAHEVNQPLAAIVATSHACSRWLSADPPNLERAKITLNRIIRDANSASEVVSRIRALFNQLGKSKLPADITKVIAGVRGLMADELATKNIQVETEFAANLPPALIDPVQMEQVLVNLIRNAIEALDTVVDGNRLIRLRAVLDSDNAIRVEVQDVGPGMKEPEQAFEPFFTTKKDGMGMGLAICRSIIESHNGRLWAISSQPRGTTLAFTLPIQARDAA